MVLAPIDARISRSQSKNDFHLGRQVQPHWTNGLPRAGNFAVAACDFSQPAFQPRVRARSSLCRSSPSSVSCAESGDVGHILVTHEAAAPLAILSVIAHPVGVRRPSVIAGIEVFLEICGACGAVPAVVHPCACFEVRLVTATLTLLEFGCHHLSSSLSAACVIRMVLIKMCAADIGRISVAGPRAFQLSQKIGHHRVSRMMASASCNHSF